MLKTMPNQKPVTIKLTRHELIDLMLLCAAHYDDGGKWYIEHGKCEWEE